MQLLISRFGHETSQFDTHKTLSDILCMEIHITDFPLSPSQNELISPRKRGSRGRKLRSSDKYIAFKGEVQSWWINNGVFVRSYRSIVERWLQEGWFLQVDCTFHFEYSRVFTQDGRPKRLDSANYLKATLDELAKVLGVDDKYFWIGTYNKMPVQEGGSEWTEIRINQYYPRISNQQQAEGSS